MTTLLQRVASAAFRTVPTGRDAVLVAPGVDPLAVRIVLERRDAAGEVLGFGRSPGVQAPGWLARLLRSESPDPPQPGSWTLLIDGTTYRIRQVNEDVGQLQWLCDVYPVS